VDARGERQLPFAFDISMGVRRGDAALAAALDAVIRQRAGEIRAVLRRYGVPLVPARKEVRG
jgi:mxaJ protein